jgi:hypothetical protein
MPEASCNRSSQATAAATAQTGRGAVPKLWIVRDLVILGALRSPRRSTPSKAIKCCIAAAWRGFWDRDFGADRQMNGAPGRHRAPSRESIVHNLGRTHSAFFADLSEVDHLTAMHLISGHERSVIRDMLPTTALRVSIAPLIHALVM